MAKLTGEERKKSLREKLEEQRHLLGKSVKEFASGDLPEAVRIATTVRVLVHETGRCKPLLKQITPSYLDLRILDHPPAMPAQPPPAGMQTAVIMSVPVGVKISAEGGVPKFKACRRPARSLDCGQMVGAAEPYSSRSRRFQP
jgi:hypothetical protein